MIALNDFHAGVAILIKRPISSYTSSSCPLAESFHA